ncbi:PilZ domain-containing protein [Paenibacillus psychroresistens]|uniref:PilZ domain-containing protein n=1 Tax=Paenibacillus psychroresistens TaxID=1778678 RepID=A0A6B8RDK5_9BACL|nr:PilZ domain-containing protein [Paenibacillus psychroresistens]QGQ93456.1 PilZ domain-containing protein [Paenibacillus psychroresistens]
MVEDRSAENLELGFKETQEPNMSILVHCRTVVEKKDYVSTGILTYAEGDMVEVEIGDYQLFDLGTIVKLTIYTPAGIFMFNTTVIAKDVGFLILINPPENRRKFSEKRKETRIEMDKNGYLHGVCSQGSSEMKAFAEPIDVLISNISQSGIGFTVNGDLELKIDEHIEVAAELGINLSFRAQVVRVEKLEAISQYGAEIIEIHPDQNKALRAFILKSQVVNRASLKKAENQKRVFK